MHLTGQQASGSGTDLELVRNIGLNAWIDGATGTFGYNQTTQALNYPITLIGNSVRYDLTFDYTGTGCVPNSTTSTYNNTALFNNRVTGIYQSPNRITNPSFTLNPVTAGNYEIPVTVSTALAGGVGKGSSYTFKIPVQITAADSMGSPIITYSTATLTITAGSTITVSGIQYYGPGSYITIPAKWLRISNFYNIVYNSSLVNYVQFGGAGSKSELVGNLNYGAPLYNTAYNHSIDNPASGTNPQFANRSAFNVSVVSSGAVTITVTNNKQASTSQNPFFPGNSNVSTFTQSSIGYLAAAPDETTIPPNQGGTNSISGLTSMTRVSIKTATTVGVATDNPDTTSGSPAIEPFNAATLTKYDAQYNPYTGNFHATNQSTSLASSYVLIASPAMPASTKKYLTLKVAVSAILKAFNIRLGDTAATAGNITNLWVQWVDTANSVTSWYDAGVYYTGASGCQAGTATDNNTKWGIQMNKALDDSGSYQNTSFIYINIEFTDKIRLSEINIV